MHSRKSAVHTLARSTESTGSDASAGVDGERLAASTSPDARRVSRSQWQPARAAQDETLFALANGALGVRGGIEESPSPTQGTFIAGVWERSAIHYHERHHGFARTTDTRVPVADATAIRIRLGDTPADPAHGEVLAFERTLDMRAGELVRSIAFRTAQGATLEVKARRLVPLAHPGLLCIRWTLRSLDYTGPVTLESAIVGNVAAAAQGDDPRFGAGAGLAMQIADTAADAHEARLVQHTRASAIGVACVQRQRVTGAAFAQASADANAARQCYAARLAPGGEIEVEKYVAYAWTQPGGSESDAQLHASAQGTLDAAMAQGFDALAQAQADEVAAFWSVADFSIDAVDAEAGRRDEQALAFNLFHLFQSANRDGYGGIAAKGLTGEGYEGHVFWDSETFVLPVFAFTAPQLMKPSLVWRFRTLERARVHAREMGHARGALYAWRTIAGDECSAHYPSGSAQYHINAAVAFAVRLYVEATGDTAFLAEMGAEMLVETARVWLQVGFFSERRGGVFCICAVTGPDEYTALVDNNYYTNRMAQEHLRFAVAVMRELAAESPQVHAALARKLALDASEIDAWSRAADAMYLPYDERLGIVAQDDTFLDKPLWDIKGTPPEQFPLLMHNHPLNLYRYQVCKQADALLAFVLADATQVDWAVRRRSFDYYEAITVHDSTLSPSTFAVLAADIGDLDKAQAYFHENLRIDLDDLHGNTSHGAHMAAMAGSWLGLAWGFGGVRVRDGRLGFAPKLPPGWRSYRFGILWNGVRIGVTVDADGARYAYPDGVSHPVTGKRIDVDTATRGEKPVKSAGAPSPSHASAATPSEAGASRGFPRPFKALIFDLDGVLADTAHLHHAAWKRLAGELGLAWDDAIGEKLKGVDRMASLAIVLGDAAKKYTAAQQRELADRKNGYYRREIATFSSDDLLPGALASLKAARAAGLKVALASASRSARELVERMGVAGLFDHVVDSATIARAKPDPEIFLRAAQALGVVPADCLGIEDAQAGVAAIKAAGMAALGIGDAAVLRGADAVLPSLAEFDLAKFVTKKNREDSVAMT
ncbi:MAG: beta-phosphoglucomutase [Proteobacteria bacterium]|nr:beta-phosphoglucomutase [Pseudomonadota bacterium]